MRVSKLLCCGLLLALGTSSWTSAQKPRDPDTSKRERKTNPDAKVVAESGSVVRSTLVLSLRPPKKLPSFTPEREAAAQFFVQKHHPELASLLIQLKESSPEKYQQAIRELFWTTEALATINDRDSKRYELELDAWKNQSRMQLLAARLSMFPNEDAEKELHQAVNEQVEIQIRLLQHERERQRGQLKRIEDNLKAAQSRRQDTADRRFKALLRSIEKSRAAAQTASSKE